MLNYVIANGPDKGKRVGVLAACRTFTVPQEENFEVYEPAGEIKIADGTAVAMVVGSRYCFSNTRRHVIFAHKDWPPMVIDLRASTIHECGVRDDSVASG